MVEIEGRSVLTKFIILPKAKGNRTLLGTDFLSSASLVLDVKNTCWYFWDNPTLKYLFGEELDIPSIVEKMSCNTCKLREGEGESLTSVCVCPERETYLPVGIIPKCLRTRERSNKYLGAPHYNNLSLQNLVLF
ncbi:retrovirus-related Pol polyprotein from transposon 297 [Trichonephila clavipes]|nr:retrovirus-related Pol polyprotein from transposon 297 [Trichonephila clavipes]